MIKPDENGHISNWARLGDSIKNVFTTFKTGATEAATATGTLGKMVNSTIPLVSKLGQGAIGLKAVFNSFGTFGKAAIVIASITLATTAIVKFHDALTKSREEIGELAKASEANINNIQKSYKNLQDTVNTTKERYAELAQGVEQSASSIDNVNLSHENYEEFLDISNQIAEVAPSLVQGYDAQGNAILNLDGSYNDIISTLDTFIAKQREAANFEIKNNLPDLYAGVKADSEIYESMLALYKNEQETYQNAVAAFEDSNFQKQFIENLKSGSFSIGAKTYDEAKIIADYYTSALNELNVEFSKNFTRQSPESAYQFTISPNVDVDSLINEIDDIKLIGYKYSDTLASISQNITNTTNANVANWNKLKNSLIASLSTESMYSILNDDMQNVVTGIINSLNFSEIDMSNWDWEDLEHWIDTNVLGLFQGDNASKIQTAFNNMFNMQDSLKEGQISIGEFKNYLNTFIDHIEGIAPEVKDAILSSFEYTHADGATLDEMINHVQNKLQDEFDHMVNYMTLEELQLAYSIENTGEMTFEEMYNKIDTLRRASENDINLNVTTKWDAAQAAKESENAIDKYNQAIEDLTTAQDLLNKGLYGTDDFKAIAAWLSPNDMTDPTNFLENIKNVGKYFQEGIQGPKAFVDELERLGYATSTLNEDGLKQYALTLNDIPDIANRMGLSLEAFMTVLNTLPDYGFSKDWFGTAQEGMDHLGDLYAQKAELQAKLFQLENIPEDEQSKTAIKETQNAIDALDDSIQMTQAGLDNLLTGKVADANEQMAKEVEKNALTKAQSFVDSWNNLDPMSDSFELQKEALLKEMNEFITENGQYDIEFKFNEDGSAEVLHPLEDINKAITTAQERLDKMRNEDGSLNMNDSEVRSAANELRDLYVQKQQLSQPTIMSVDASSLNDSASEVILKLQEMQRLASQIEIDEAIGIDTIESHQRLQELTDEINALSSDEATNIKAQLDIQGATTEEILEKIQSAGTIEIPATFKADETVKVELTSDSVEIDATVNGIEDLVALKAQLDEIPKDVPVTVRITTPNETLLATVQSYLSKYFPDITPEIILDENGAIATANTVGESLENIPTSVKSKISITDNASNALRNVWGLISKISGNHTSTITTVYKNTNQGSVVNGTAHANGTLFSPQNAMWHQLAYHMGTTYGIQHGAYVGGNWGIPYDQTALVGELGSQHPEMLVRDGKWSLITNPQFMNLRKGDIIFNANQVKSLLSNGYVTGKGRTIGFNAHVNGTADGNAYNGGSQGGFFTGYTPTYSSSSYSSTTAKSTAAAEKAAEDFSETVDFIALAIERMNAEIELHKSLAENLYQTYRNQNAELNVSISQTEELLKFQKKAYNRYMEQAKASGLSDEYVKLIQNGQLDIRTITDEDLKKKIDEYTEYYNLAQDTRQEIVNTAQSLNELKLQKLDNIVDDFDRITDNASTLYDMIEALQELNELKGISKTVDDLVKLMEIQVDIAGYKQGEADRLTKEFEALVASGDIDKYNDDWYEWIDQINAAKTEAIEAEKAAYELKNEIFELQFVKPLEKTIEQLTIAEDELSTLLDLLGEAELFDENGISVTFSFAGISKLAMLGEQLALAKKRSAEWSKAISELDKNLANGNITQEQYNEKLKEYSDGQRQAALDTKAAMDAIIDLRIEGLEKSYTAYEKLINIRKKDMDAQKKYQEQQEALSDKQSEINALEAQIKMAQDDPAQLQRVKQLEAQKKELQDEYNEMVKENRHNAEIDAYDEDLENYREYVDEETKKLQSDLNYRSQIIQETLGIVSDNHEDTYDHLSMLAEVYGVVLQTNVVDKWSDATTAAQAYYDAVNKAAAQAQIVSDKIEVGTVKPTDTTPSDEQSKKDIAYSNPINSKYAYGESDINKLYQELLGRDADVEGLKTWLALQSKGGTLDDVRQGIMNSAEYKALKGQGSGNSNSESVTNSSNQNNSDVWKNIATNPSTKGANKYNKSIGYSIYDRIAWNGYKPGWASQKQLWSNLGGSGTYSGTSSQNVWMVEQLKKRGFRDGGVAELIKKSGEHGIAFVRNKEALVSDRHVPIMQDVLEAMPTIDNIFKGIQGTMGHYNLKPIDYNVTMHYDNMLNVEGSVDATVISNLKKFANEVSNQATNQVMKTLKNQSYKPGYKGLGR